MTAIKISDKLGAMAIIDELQARQIAVEEHLNLPQLRERIAAQIRDYYRTNGQNVDDALIDQGVSQWFADRLRYRAPTLSPLQRLGVFLYLTSGRWLKWVVTLVLVTLAVLMWRHNQVVSQTETLVRQAATRSLQIHNARNDMDQLEQTLREASAIPLNYAVTPGAQLLQKLGQQINQIRTLSDGVSAPDSHISLAEARGQLDALNQTRQQILALTKQATAVAQDWRILYQRDTRLSGLLKAPDADPLIRQYPTLRQTQALAVSALHDNAADSEQKIDRLAQQLQQARTLSQIARLTNDWQQWLKKTPILAKDRPRLDNQINHLRSLVQNASLESDSIPPEIGQAMSQFEDDARLLTTPLTLNIVDRIGEKSGVERTWDTSGGKSWYLIVEAQTPNGKPFEMWVTDSETGQRVKRSVFGIRINQAEYQRLRQDKLADGHIDHRLVGTKDAYRFDFRYIRPVKDGIITQW